ncbi:MAG: hypothetical protein ACLUCI_03655 [Blautia hansenii]
MDGKERIIRLLKREEIIEVQHTNFHEKETWVGEGYERVKASQVEMIKKHYADYNADKDYVLWIVADFYYPFTAVIQGNVEVRKINGEKIEVPQLTRTPYINKNIRQVSMKSGRKRLYGVPLVFHSFEELYEVNEIQIRWDLYIPVYLRDEPLDLHVENVLVRYHLSFAKTNEENHFFTIYSKDFVLESFNGESSDVQRQKYYEEFDLAIQTKGSFELDRDENPVLPPMVTGIYDLTDSIEEGKIRDLTEKETGMLNSLTGLQQDSEMIRRNLQEVAVKDDVQWSGYFYDRTEVLQATSIADLLYMTK